MIYVQPGASFAAVFNFGTTGLTGSLGFEIVEPDGDIVAARTGVGIVENPAGSGVYMLTADAPTVSGYYSVVIDDGVGTYLTEEMAVAGAGVATITPPLGGHYTTPTAVRVALGVAEDALSDEAAYVLIEDAEDILDHLLGGWPIDPTTGRKIVQAEVEDWQWVKLMRAATKLTGLLFENPDLVKSDRWQSESGPDFSFSGPIGGQIKRSVLLPLDQSELRRLGGRARSGSPRRFDSFFSARRHNGT